MHVLKRHTVREQLNLVRFLVYLLVITSHAVLLLTSTLDLLALP